jgi:hypothetical protein
MRHTAGNACLYCMDRRTRRQHHASVRVLPHIKRLDDCLGDFLRVICDCGAVREIEPGALALVSWTLKQLALRMPSFYGPQGTRPRD